MKKMLLFLVVGLLVGMMISPIIGIGRDVFHDYYKISKRINWRVSPVEANSEEHLTHGIILSFHDKPVIRIGHEGISRFTLDFPSPHPFHTDEEGRIDINW